MLKDAYYFPHDSNARNDEKILYMRSKFGVAGYAIYWMFIEKMHEKKDGKLTVSLLESLAVEFNVDITLLSDFYNTAITIKLFVTDGEMYWSERVLKNKAFLKEMYKKKSDAGKKGMSVRWQNKETYITDDNSVITDDNSVITKHNKRNEMKRNEMKRNKIKEKKRNNSVFVPPSLDDIKKYIDDNNYSVNAEEFYKFFTVGNWIDSKGNKVKNWKQKLITWENHGNKNTKSSYNRNENNKLALGQFLGEYKSEGF